MKHLKAALESLGEQEQKFIKIEQKKDGPLTLAIQIQDGKPEPHGVVGLQATDILHFLQGLYGSLNASYPCKENEDTLRHLAAADFHQQARKVE